MSPRAQHARRSSRAADVRPYQEGDDPGWVDWELTRTSGRMMVRVPDESAGSVLPAPLDAVERLWHTDRRLVVGGGAVVAAAVAGTLGIMAISSSGSDTPATTTTRSTATRSTATTHPKPPAVRVPTGNLLRNAAFAHRLAGWHIDGGRMVRRRSGGRLVAQVTARAARPVLVTQRVPVRVSPRGTLRARMIVRAAAPGARRTPVLLQVRALSAGGQVLGLRAARATLTGHPRVLTVMRPIPRGMRAIVLRLIVRPRHAQRHVRFQVWGGDLRMRAASR